MNYLSQMISLNIIFELFYIICNKCDPPAISEAFIITLKSPPINHNPEIMLAIVTMLSHNSSHWFLSHFSYTRVSIKSKPLELFWSSKDSCWSVSLSTKTLNPWLKKHHIFHYNYETCVCRDFKTKGFSQFS